MGHSGGLGLAGAWMPGEDAEVAREASERCSRGWGIQGQKAAPGCVSSSVLSREPTEQVLGSEDLERRKGLHS